MVRTVEFIVSLSLIMVSEFGLYVDKHGVPSRNTGPIEWEGQATRVALHAPYILLFDKRFIEIRNIDTCRLSQILPGSEIQCSRDEKDGVYSWNERYCSVVRCT